MKRGKTDEKTGVSDILRRFFYARGYTCDGCGKETFDYPKERLCARCKGLLERNNSLVCEKCGRKTVALGICMSCKDSPPLFARGLSPFVYHGEVAMLIKGLKSGKRWLSAFFGEEMSALLLSDFSKREGQGCDECKNLDEYILTFVPLTKRRERERGYNQARALAEIVSRQTGIALKDVFVKLYETPQQKSLPRRERLTNLMGAYRVLDKQACAGKRVIVVDDIMTTGATGSECARALGKAGVKEVLFLTAASLPEQK